jgi:8-oxo-dGTP pyrophosphatase MutT (NUDIX family)
VNGALSVGLHTDAARTIETWQPPDQGQRALKQAFLAFLAARPDAMDRSCEPGHLTSSAVVLDAAGAEVLLTLHRRIGRWVQLGGHCESTDDTLAGAALREAAEESGIRGLMLAVDGPVHLDVHPITCSLGLPTRHFDVRFAIRAPAGSIRQISTESDDLAFFPVGALPAGCDDSARAAIATALHLIR